MTSVLSSRCRVFVAVLAGGCLTAAVMTVAGPLDPPAGAVSGTYKTLTEVEPRIALSAANTPGDSNSVFRITQPGSYYLTANMTAATNFYGIEIAADNVTVDLNSFVVTGSGAGTADGVSSGNGSKSICIRNGMVRNFGGSGVNLNTTNATECRVEGVLASGNVSLGITVGTNSVVTGCKALSNGSHGIRSAGGGLIENCQANGNAGNGIFSVTATTVKGCVTESNNDDGVDINDHGIVIDCTSRTNVACGFALGEMTRVERCTAAANGDDGYAMTNYCTIVDSCAIENTHDGIQVASSCIVERNHCMQNGPGVGGGNGILVTGAGSQLTDNTCAFSDVAFRVSGAGNILRRNMAGTSTTNRWVIAAGGNRCFVVLPGIAAGGFSGNTGGTSFGNDVDANFSY